MIEYIVYTKLNDKLYTEVLFTLKCVVCGKETTCNSVYILPCEFIKDCNYDSANVSLPLIPLKGENTLHGYQNMVKVCDGCKVPHSSDTIIPSPNNVVKHLNMYSKNTLINYINFIYSNRVPIFTYLNKNCVKFNEETRLFLTNMKYMKMLEDLEEMIIYVEKGEIVL